MNNMKNAKKYYVVTEIIALAMILSFVLPTITKAENFLTRSGNYDYCSSGCNNGSYIIRNGNYTVTNGSYTGVSSVNPIVIPENNYQYSATNGSYTGGSNGNSGNNYQYFVNGGNYTVTNGSYSGDYNGYYYNNNGNNNYGQLNGTCSSGVTNTQVGGTVTWTATATGGNGFYNYYWTGDEGISSSGQYVTKVYTYNGPKNAIVTITSNGQSITRTCSITVGNGNQILSYVKTNNIPLTASVLLSDVPYTGAGDVVKVVSFIFGLILWSLFITYYILRIKSENQLVSVSVSEKFEKELNNGDKVFSDFSKAIEIEKKEIESVEDYARMNKILLSNEAVIKIIKLSKLGRANAAELLRKMSGNDWVCMGEGEVEKYI